MRRASTVVAALCAAITELVLVAATGNQWVVDHLIRNEKPSELPRNRELKAVLTSFPWRWTPESHQRMLWLGEIVAVVGLVVVVFLLMLAFLGPMRPQRRFFAVFLGAWGIVVALTQVAAIGRAMLAYSDLDKDTVDPQRYGRIWFAVFDGPTSETVLFGAASGLIVAIVVGIVAALTSRRVDEDEEIDTSIPVGPDEVPEWSAALGAPQPFGATQAIGGPAERAASERAADEWTQSWPPPDPADRLSGWPEPESTARVQGPDAPEATTRISPPAAPRDPAPPRTEQSAPAREPAPTQPPARPEPPASVQPASTGQSAPTSRDDWSNVTQSTSDTVRPYSEPPTEITLPRAPQPTAELPPPGSLPGSPPASTGRLPLPEERESDES